ncbi:MAG: protein tyrosine phosphatase [Lewinella sp.]
MPVDRPKVLFVCSRNEWRSRTAENIWRTDDRLTVRSAGTSRRARVRVTEALLDWADIVFVMEEAHRRQLRERFGQDATANLIVLDIPDEYQYMDTELVNELRDVVAPYLE